MPINQYDRLFDSVPSATATAPTTGRNKYDDLFDSVPAAAPAQASNRNHYDAIFDAVPPAPRAPIADPVQGIPTVGDQRQPIPDAPDDSTSAGVLGAVGGLLKAPFNFANSGPVARALFPSQSAIQPLLGETPYEAAPSPDTVLPTNPVAAGFEDSEAGHIAQASLGRPDQPLMDRTDYKPGIVGGLVEGATSMALDAPLFAGGAAAETMAGKVASGARAFGALDASKAALSGKGFVDTAKAGAKGAVVGAALGGTEAASFSKTPIGVTAKMATEAATMTAAAAAAEGRLPTKEEYFTNLGLMLAMHGTGAAANMMGKPEAAETVPGVNAEIPIGEPADRTFDPNSSSKGASDAESPSQNPTSRENREVDPSALPVELSGKKIEPSDSVPPSVENAGVPKPVQNELSDNVSIPQMKGGDLNEQENAQGQAGRQEEALLGSQGVTLPKIQGEPIPTRPEISNPGINPDSWAKLSPKSQAEVANAAKNLDPKSLDRYVMKRLVRDEGVSREGGAPESAGNEAVGRAANELEAAPTPDEPTGETQVAYAGPGGIIKQLAEKVKNSAAGQDVGHFIKRWTYRAQDLARNASPELADQMERVQRQSEGRAGPLKMRLEDAHKGLSRAEKQDAAWAVNNPEFYDQASDKVRSYADAIRENLDPLLVAAREEVGFKRKMKNGESVPSEGSGKPYPQILNKEGRALVAEAAGDKKTARVMDVAQSMVDSNQASDVPDAISKLKAMHDSKTRGNIGYFESSRTMLPREYWDLNADKTLPGFIERKARDIESNKIWDRRSDEGKSNPTTGDLRRRSETEDNSAPNIQKAYDLINQVAVEKGKKHAEPLREYFDYTFGKENPSEVSGAQAAGVVNRYESFSKLSGALTPIKNATQLLANSSRYPLKARLKGVRDYFVSTPAGQAAIEKMGLNGKSWAKAAMGLSDKVRESGAIQSNFFHDRDTALSKVEDIATKGFQVTEHANQKMASMMAYHSMMDDAASLMKSGEAAPLSRYVNWISKAVERDPGSFARRLEKHGVSNDRVFEIQMEGKPLTAQELFEGMAKGNQDINFAQNMLTSPTWWNNHPIVRMMSKFKPWGVNQLRLIVKDVGKEAAHGNMMPLVRLAAGSAIAGEIYNVIRDKWLGKEESILVKWQRTGEFPKDATGRLLADMVDGGMVGMLADLTYGVGGYLQGPAIKTARNVGAFVGKTLMAPDMAASNARTLVESEFPAVKQAEEMAQSFFKSSEDKSISARDYSITRERARRFQKTLRPIQEGVMEQVFGESKSFGFGAKTAYYQRIGSLINTGDVEGAGKVVAKLLARAGGDGKRLVTSIQGVQASSKLKAPFGGVAESEWKNLMASVPAKDAERMKDTHKQWIRDFTAALKSGLEIYKSRH